MMDDVKVQFFHERRGVLATMDLDAIPRSGEGISLAGQESSLVVWNIAWRLDGDASAVWVMVKTRQEYDDEFRALTKPPSR